MAVEVYGHLNGAVAHLIVHIDRTFTVLQEERGERMAQVMESDLSHSRTFQQTEECQADPVLIQWLPLLVTKDP
jgi:hypothetical protein